MKSSIYIINPAPDYPAYFSADVVTETTGRGTANVIALALPTVAALVPDAFEVSLCDESITPVDLDTDAEYIGITGMISQLRRVRELAAEFRRRGKTVIIGGPHATLRPEAMRPHCDILVRGEIEDIAAELFDDLLRGDWRNEYFGGKCDLKNSPVPRLDLYPNDRTLTGAVQTSRGCPFNCDFCDVIQFHGRRQRFKPVATILAELTQLHALGYRQVFITDDNLTANKKRARTLLTAIRDWNRSQTEPVAFVTQLSIEAATDEALLELAAEAGLSNVFVGIESPSEDALREVGKVNNCGRNFIELMERFTAFGITVVGGMIVGFDADGPDIFKRQLEFADSLPIPFFTPVALFAPETTPLYTRLTGQGRIKPQNGDSRYLPWITNVTPAGMSSEQLSAGLQWLCNNLYEPARFAKRVRRMVDLLGSRRPAGVPEARRGTFSLRRVERDALSMVLRLPGLGRAEAKLALRLTLLVLRRPSAFLPVLNCILSYMQVRHLFAQEKYWAPELVREPEPAIQDDVAFAATVQPLPVGARA